MARQERNKKPIKPKEQINHPSHYNSHPSGIECIEIIHSFGFNLGNSFKYLYRRENKENLIQDIKKSLWYVQDELKRRKTFKEFLGIFKIPNLFKYFDYKKRRDMIIEVTNAEVSNKETIPMIYFCLSVADYYPFDTYNLEIVEKYINLLIEEIEGKQKQIKNV
jgi:hypothetical protein